MSDLLNKLGSKSSAEGAGAPEPSQASKSASPESKPAKVEVNRGDDMINQLNKAGNKEPKQADGAGDVESKSVSGEGEPSGDEPVKDPDTWTKDSALKEIKKLREENKAYRVKYQEKMEQKVQELSKEMENRLSARQEELAALKAAKEELEEIKAKEADKKRDMSERLADREAKLADLKAKFDSHEKLFQEKVKEYQDKLDIYETQVAAQQEVYKQQLDETLAEIPEKFKDIANTMVKGAADPRDALMLVREAQLKGMFEDKTIVVNHSVPGAGEGARASKEKLEEGDKAHRAKMTSHQKIGEALKQIRSGQPNSAFRLNK